MFSTIFLSYLFIWVNFTNAAIIEVPYKDSALVRNPRFKNQGKFVTLADFLQLAKTNKTGGVLINIEVSWFFPSIAKLKILVKKDL